MARRAHDSPCSRRKPEDARITSGDPDWQFYPNTTPLLDHLLKVIEVFETAKAVDVIELKAFAKLYGLPITHFV